MKGRAIAFVAILLVAFAALVATRTIDLGIFPAATGDAAGGGGVAPAAVEGEAPKDPKLIALEKGGGAPAVAPAAAPEAFEPTMPSEAKGTAPERGGGTIRGRVVFGASHGAIAGARVRLLRPDSLFHYLRVSPKGHHDELLVETDKEGRFAFREVLPATGYAILARAGASTASAAVTKQRIDLSPRESLDVGDLVLGKVGGLGGRVTDVDGKPVAGARVAVTWHVKNEFGVVLSDPATLPWTEAEATSDAEGRWSCPALEPGDKTVAVRAPSGATDALSPVACTEGQQKTDVDFALKGKLFIAGVAVRTDGAPLPGVRVFAAPSNRPAAWTVETGADGAFRLGPLEDGAYRVGALLPGMPIRLAMSKRAGDETLRFEFPYPGALVGKVVAQATRAPIKAFRVLARFDGEQDFVAKYVSNLVQKTASSVAIASPDGTFRLEGLQPGPHKVVVEAEGFPPAESAPVAVVAGRDVDVPAIELVEGHTVSGVVVDAKGSPIAGARIYVVDGGDESWDWWDVEEYEEHLKDDAVEPEGVTDDAGAFRTKPLSPRTFRVLALADGWLATQQRDVNVAAKSVEGLRLALSRGGRARVKTAFTTGAPASRANVVAWHESGSFLRFQTGDDGKLDAGPLRSGRWVVAWNGRKAEEAGRRFWSEVESASVEARFERLRAIDGAREVLVSPGETVDVALRVPRLVTLRGRVPAPTHGNDGPGAYLGEGESGNWKALVVDAQGRFTAIGVEPGPVYVFLRVLDEAAESITYERKGPFEVPDAESFELDATATR